MCLEKRTVISPRLMSWKLAQVEHPLCRTNRQPSTSSPLVGDFVGSGEKFGCCCLFEKNGIYKKEFYVLISLL